MKHTVKAQIFTVLLICLLCSGCGKGRTSKQIEDQPPVSTEFKAEQATETDLLRETDFSTNSKPLTPPRTKEEEEELYGSTNEAGEWIPPKDSHIDSKTGNVYNKDGSVIGNIRGPEYFKNLSGGYG